MSKGRTASMTMHKELTADISAEALAQLGDGEIAYVRTVRSEDVPVLFPQAPDIEPGLELFALHAAEKAGVAQNKADEAERERKKAENSAKREKELAEERGKAVKLAEERAKALKEVAEERGKALKEVVAEKENVKKLFISFSHSRPPLSRSKTSRVLLECETSRSLSMTTIGWGRGCTGLTPRNGRLACWISFAKRSEIRSAT